MLTVWPPFAGPYGKGKPKQFENSLLVEHLQGDPLSGNLFLFSNRRRNRIKILWRDGSGLIICTKRLEHGRFTIPVSEKGQAGSCGKEFNARIHGLEVRSKRNWYRR
jgi:transposase